MMLVKTVFSVFLFAMFAVQLVPAVELGENDYLNEHDLPVVIEVPYYEKGSKEEQPLELVLQPGDLYKGRNGQNALIYEKYGLVEKTLAEFVKKERPAPVVNWRDGRPADDKAYEKYLAGLKTEKMPEDWVKRYRSYYSDELENIEYKIKDQLEWKKTNAHDEKKLKKLEKDKAFFQSISSRIDDLEDPASDPDQDGLDNRTEYARGTNPFLKDYVSAYPMYYEVVYDHSPVVTGTFYLVNSFSAPFTVKWSNGLNAGSDFYKLNIDLNGQPAPQMTMTLPPVSTNRLDCYFSAEAFPRYFDDAYEIYFYDVTNEYETARFGVRFHTYEDNSQPLTSPEITEPKKGSLFTVNDKLTLRWIEPEGKKMISDRRERINYKIQLIDPFGKDGEKDVSKGGNAFVKKHQNFKANDFKPGTYFWRVNKQDRFHVPVGSSWSWFAVGKEMAKPILPIKGDSRLRCDFYLKSGDANRHYVFDLTKGLPFKHDVFGKEGSHFRSPLPEGLSYVPREDDKNRSLISGTPEKVGRYTNLFVCVCNRYDGKDIIETQRFIFVVHNDRNKCLSESFYNATKKAVVHDLTVMIPFEYAAKSIHDEFYCQGGPALNENTDAGFLYPLPDGLEGKRAENGDYVISGTPLKGGCLTNVFTVKCGTVSSEERHIFRIQDLGEPVPEEKRKFTESKTYFWTSNYEEVKHKCFFDVSVNYFLKYDTPKIGWNDFVKEGKFELLGELPKGLRIDMCDPPPSMDTNKFHATWAICGKPLEAGVFTNYIQYTEGEKVRKVRHVFRIKEEPAVWYR